MKHYFQVAALAAILLSTNLYAEEPAELSKVTVTATGKQTSDMAQAVNLLTADDLKQQNNSIGEALAQQLGIHNASFGQAVGRPIIRGMSGARVKIMQDGIDSLDLSAISPDHAVNVNSHNAKQIEVLRGPATLLYGGGAFGGVVNVVDQRIPHDGTHDGLESEVAVKYNSVNQGKTLSLKNQGNLDAWHWHIDASGSQADDYKTAKIKHAEEEHEDETEEEHEQHSTSTLANSDIKYKKHLTFGNSYDFSQGHVGIAVSRQTSDFALPGHEHAEEEHDGETEEEHEEHEEGDARIAMQQTRIDFETYWQTPFSFAESLELKFGNNNYRHSEYLQSDEGKETESLFSRKSWEARTELKLLPWYGTKNLIGVQASQSDVSIVGHEAILPKTESESWALFWLAEKEFDQWSLEAGSRVDNNKHTPESVSGLNSSCSYASEDVKQQSFLNSNFSIAAIRHLNDQWQVSTSVMSAKRAPEAQELYSCGQHASTMTFEVGNPNLTSESAINIDLSLRKVSGDFTMAFNIFHNSVADYIYAKNRGTESEGLPIYDYSQADVTLKGIELEGRYQIFDQWSLGLMADGMQATLDKPNQNTSKFLPRMPAERIGMNINYDSQNWLANVNFQHTEKQTDTAQFETETKGYQQLSLSGSYIKQLADIAYRIDLSANNVLNQEVRYHSSFVKNSVPQPGRSLQLAFGLTF